MKFQKFVGILVALMLLVSMGSAMAEEKTTITFWHTYGDSETPILEDEIIPAFEAAHPDIEVEAVRQDGSQFNQMLVTAFGTGMVPDVARVDIVKTASYAQLGGTIALDDLPGFAEIKDSVLAGPLSTNYYNGKYYGLPLNTNCKAAIVNMTALAKLGFTEMPATMEEFIQASLEKSPGSPTISISSLSDWDLYPYFWLFGGVLTNDDFTKASGYMDSEASVKAVQTLRDLHDQGVITIRDVDGTPDAWDGINSEFTMFFDGPWFPFTDTIVPATIPTYEGRTASVVGGENIVLFAGSTKQEAAWEFAKYMMTEEVQLKLLTVGVIPTLKSCAESDQVQNDSKWSVYMQQLSTAQSRIPTPQASTVEQLWTDAMSMIFVEKADIQQTLTSTAAQVDAELSK
jgi:multiple sugar transport system substrate-binding protein